MAAKDIILASKTLTSQKVNGAKKLVKKTSDKPKQMHSYDVIFFFKISNQFFRFLNTKFMANPNYKFINSIIKFINNFV